MWKGGGLGSLKFCPKIYSGAHLEHCDNYRPRLLYVLFVEEFILTMRQLNFVHEKINVVKKSYILSSFPSCISWILYFWCYSSYAQILVMFWQYFFQSSMSYTKSECYSRIYIWFCLLQVENKNELIHKLETENSSLTRQLNDKSSTLERFQSELMKISTELDNKKKEVMHCHVLFN